MKRLTYFLNLPVKEVPMSVRLLNNCKAIGIVNVCQLAKLFFDKDERLFKRCGRKSLMEIYDLLDGYNITIDDYATIKSMFKTPYFVHLN